MDVSGVKWIHEFILDRGPSQRCSAAEVPREELWLSVYLG
jgi:hypothetical protein